MIITIFTVALFAFVFTSNIIDSSAIIANLSLVGLATGIITAITLNVIDSVRLSKLKNETIEARKETEEYRKGWHYAKNLLREYAYKEEDSAKRSALVSRIESDRIKEELLINPIDTGIPAIDVYLTMKCESAPFMGIRFTPTIKQSLTAFVNKGIRHRDLDDIVINLVENAFVYAFLGEEGKAIKGKIITLSIVGYSIIVSDNGLQFSKEILQDMGKLGNTTHGTGTGLPTVIDIVNRHGGKFDIVPDKDMKYGKSIKISFENLASESH